MENLPFMHEPSSLFVKHFQADPIELTKDQPDTPEVGTSKKITDCIRKIFEHAAPSSIQAKIKSSSLSFSIGFNNFGLIGYAVKNLISGVKSQTTKLKREFSRSENLTTTSNRTSKASDANKTPQALAYVDAMNQLINQIKAKEQLPVGIFRIPGEAKLIRETYASIRPGGQIPKFKNVHTAAGLLLTTLKDNFNKDFKEVLLTIDNKKDDIQEKQDLKEALTKLNPKEREMLENLFSLLHSIQADKNIKMPTDNLVSMIAYCFAPTDDLSLWPDPSRCTGVTRLLIDNFEEIFVQKDTTHL